MGKVRPVLRLSVVQEWRRGEKLPENWDVIRKAVLSRDDNACFYCGFSSPKYMNVHHKEGRHHDNSPDNLITVCPLCHSCLHIGHAGLNRMGSLLLLAKEMEQSKVNRALLEGASLGVFFFVAFRERLPVEKDFGSAGLVELANAILHKNVRPNGRFLFFPDYRKYDIVKYLMRTGE